MRILTRIIAKLRRTRPAPPRLSVVLGSITGQPVDAIVNAAKTTLMGGGGVDGAIHWAGGPTILEECREIRALIFPDGLPAGQAVATGAGNLPAEWVIHTVGPIYDTKIDQAATLRSCYTESLAVADQLGARTVAFPLISSGVYGWPIDDAIVQAVAAIRTARTSVEQVRLVLYDVNTYKLAKAIVAEEQTQ